MAICKKCGNTGSTRDNPLKCITCGRERKKKENINSIPLEEKKNIDYKNLIPARYRDTMFSIQKLKSNAYKTEDEDSKSFNIYCGVLDIIHKNIVTGALPKMSFLITAKAGNGKRTWAYSLIKLAIENNMSVNPLLDLKDVYNLVVGRQEENIEPYLRGMIDYDLYTSDLCIISIDQVNSKYAYIIPHIIDKRSSLDKPTIFISNISKANILKKAPDLLTYINQKPLKAVKGDTQALTTVEYYSERIATERELFYKNLNNQSQSQSQNTNYKGGL